MKQFFPDTKYSMKKRMESFGLFAILILLVGGFATYMFISGQSVMGGIMLVFLVIPLASIPSTFVNYPTKHIPLIEVNGNRVKLYSDKKEYKASEILAVSVLIDVPNIKGTVEERMKELRRIASIRPTEAMLGTCDLLVKDDKGKDETKYNIVSDCIGALEALLEMGVKKYRIIYCMKKLNAPATYSLAVNAGKNQEYQELSEKDRLSQLI
ncbi:MAG: hypothetical protein J6U25_00970 [Clostridia bacterium]|nr:hypothetical protein [Clostridia bacterium]